MQLYPAVSSPPAQLSPLSPQKVTQIHQCWGYIRLSDHTSLPLHIGHNLRRQDPLLRNTHVRRKCRMWHPLGRVSWCRLLHHAIHLFEGEAFGLGDQEIGVHEAADAEAAPDEEDFGAEVAFVGVDHVRGDDCDDLERKKVSAFGRKRGYFRWIRLTQFHSQLEAVDRATPRERMGRG